MADDNPYGLSEQDVADLREIALHLPKGDPRVGKVSQLLNSAPTKFEQVRNPANQKGFMETAGPEALSLGTSIVTAGPISNAYHGIRKGIEEVKSLRDTGKTLEQIHNEQQKQSGYGPVYRNVLAPLGENLGVNVQGMEESADIGNRRAIAAQAAVPAAAALAPLAAEGLIRGSRAPINAARDAYLEARTSSMRSTVPEAANLPPRAAFGAEKIFRSAAPTGGNPGFRSNVYAAAGDLAEIARSTDIAEAKGGIVQPDARVRAFVNAVNDHMLEMYESERAPQISRHSDARVVVSPSADAVSGLEFLSRRAGKSAISSLADRALTSDSLSLADADKLARVVNKELVNFESMTPSEQSMVEATNPKIGGLKALDRELGTKIATELENRGEGGIRPYERRMAALADVRDQYQSRMNAVELERKVPVLSQATRLFRGKEGVASASQAAVADVNIGRQLQQGLSELAASGIGPERAVGKGAPKISGLLPQRATGSAIQLQSSHEPIEPKSMPQQPQAGTRAQRKGLILPESTSINLGPSSLEFESRMRTGPVAYKIARDPKTGRMKKFYLTGFR